MKTSSFPLKSAGAAAFLATAALGWNLAAPPAAVEPRADDSAAVVMKRSRPARAQHSAADEAAARRMNALRSAADPEARMLATIALANSLSPADFAAWRDRHWFDMRGGPELMVFEQILMDRWRREAPEGLLEWAMKHGDFAASSLIEEWAAKDPQRLLAYFKDHPDPRTNMWMLARIAANSPDLALQRLREMVAGGFPPDALGGSQELLDALAKKSAEALEGMLDSLPPALKFNAEVALSKQRLADSFPEGIRALWDRPDGWRIFSEFSQSSPDFVSKLMGELANLPEDWRASMVGDSWKVVGSPNAGQWLDADLEGAGFAPGEVKSLRTRAFLQLSMENPVEWMRRLGEVELPAPTRANLLGKMFSNGDPEKMRGLVDQLPTEEERQAALAAIDRQSVTEEDREVKGPDDLLAKLAGLDPASFGNNFYFEQTKHWKPEEISALSTSFTGLSDDQRAKAADVITSNLDYNGAPKTLQGEALRYLAGNPQILPAARTAGPYSVIARTSEYAVGLSEKNPAAAAAWVDSLPPGEAKLWTSKNLIDNWSQYDPKAAAQWLDTRPAVDRAALEHLGKK